MPPIHGAIFDMDGLMIDTEKLFTRFWREAAAFYGFNMTLDQALSIRSLAAKYSEPLLKSIFGDSFDYQKVHAKRVEIMSAYVDTHGVEKKSGLDELLCFLKSKNIKTAVATASNFKRTSGYLKSINVFDMFDEIVCGDMIENGKPAPDIYLTAAKALNLPPNECIALEDSPNGLQSAYSAGCLPVMVPDMSQPDEELMKIIYAKCDTLSDVISLPIFD
jgi:HAD superfamily hydrolase (TIGR01509 family)